MTLKRGAIYAIAATLVICALWVIRHIHDTKTNGQILSTVLPPEDQVKVIVDPSRHTLTTVTRRADGSNETRATFLPGTGASVELRKNGSVVVTAPKWGTEINPFMGLAFGSDIVGRAALGLNGLYVQRWELGGGLLLSRDIHDTRIFAHVSYNAYKNAFVSVGIDNRKTAHIIAGLKF